MLNEASVTLFSLLNKSNNHRNDESADVKVQEEDNVLFRTFDRRVSNQNGFPSFCFFSMIFFSPENSRAVGRC